MAGVRNRRAIRWLRSQLPELVASGVISSENARAIDGYYEHDQPRVNFAFVILAALGSALVAAGIILLIAHNWDDLSRATRAGVAFLRSEEHTSELQSLTNLVCRLLLE